jgi:uncharacterized protein
MQASSIAWQDWDEETFNRAHSESRPILLYLSASWCHWCHVMEEDTLSHPEVIRQVSAHFLPIRVDSDKRPDINNRYNMGGWPTVAILTPEGDVLAGETYLPTGSMLQMLNQVHEAYRTDRQGMLRRIEEQNKLRKKQSAPSVPSGGADLKVVQSVGEWLIRTFDPDFGGFMGPMKFPMPSVLELALLLYKRNGEAKWLRMVTATLDAMRDGSIHDPVDGGFFRYSVSQDWEQPHYEKMLETQAGLLGSYLMGFQTTQDVRYRITAQDILRYVTTWLWKDDGPWFCGSQSADQEYYQSGEEDRDHLTPPPVDGVLYTHWNAMMVRELLKASVLLEEPAYQSQALNVLEVLLKRCLDGQTGVAHYYSDGRPSPYGFLADQACLTRALIEAYEVTGEERHLEQAHGLMDITLSLYWDKRAGCFRDRVVKAGDRGILAQPIYPLDDNARIVEALLRLSVLTGLEKYRELANTTLSALADRYEAYRLYAAPYAIAVDQLCRPPLMISIVAPFGDRKREAFVLAAERISDPWKVIEHLDAEMDAHRIEARGYPVGGEAMAYLCLGRTCFPPVHRPEELSQMAEQQLSHHRSK